MDQLVIYYLRGDKCWVAHSLRTDQVGTGKHPLEAMVDAMKAIRQVMALAQDDPSINPWREAPQRIQKLALKSELLPDVVSQLALRMANGLWPPNLTVAVEASSTSRPLRADLLSVGY